MPRSTDFGAISTVAEFGQRPYTTSRNSPLLLYCETPQTADFDVSPTDDRQPAVLPKSGRRRTDQERQYGKKYRVKN